MIKILCLTNRRILAKISTQQNRQKSKFWPKNWPKIQVLAKTITNNPYCQNFGLKRSKFRSTNLWFFASFCQTTHPNCIFCIFGSYRIHWFSIDSRVMGGHKQLFQFLKIFWKFRKCYIIGIPQNVVENLKNVAFWWKLKKKHSREKFKKNAPNSGQIIPPRKSFEILWKNWKKKYFYDFTKICVKLKKNL